ncbi:hypothetical protein, partial [Xylanibacter brevis]|uniref:hypothetical protein n=1 Tax=Xylanibacter brevis TaxID=83231 RepID=UPI001E3848A5
LVSSCGETARHARGGCGCLWCFAFLLAGKPQDTLGVVAGACGALLFFLAGKPQDMLGGVLVVFLWGICIFFDDDGRRFAGKQVTLRL